MISKSTEKLGIFFFLMKFHVFNNINFYKNEKFMFAAYGPIQSDVQTSIFLFVLVLQLKMSIYVLEITRLKKLQLFDVIVVSPPQ